MVDLQDETKKFLESKGWKQVTGNRVFSKGSMDGSENRMTLSDAEQITKEMLKRELKAKKEQKRQAKKRPRINRTY